MLAQEVGTQSLKIQGLTNGHNKKHFGIFHGS